MLNDGGRDDVFQQVARALSEDEPRVVTQLGWRADVGKHRGEGCGAGSTTSTKVWRNIMQL